MPAKSYFKVETECEVGLLTYWSDHPKTKGVKYQATFPAKYCDAVLSKGPWKYKDGHFVSNGLYLSTFLGILYGIEENCVRKEPTHNYFPSNLTLRTSDASHLVDHQYAKGHIPASVAKCKEQLAKFPKVKYNSRSEWQTLDIQIQRGETVKIKVNKFLVHKIPKKMFMACGRLGLCEWQTLTKENSHIHSNDRHGEDLARILLRAVNIDAQPYDLIRSDKLDYRIDTDSLKFISNIRASHNKFQDVELEDGSTGLLLTIKTMALKSALDRKFILQSDRFTYAYIVFDPDMYDYISKFEWHVKVAAPMLITHDLDAETKSLVRYVAIQQGLDIGAQFVSGRPNAWYQKAIDSGNMRKRAKYDSALVGNSRRFTMPTHKQYSTVTATKHIFAYNSEGVLALDLRKGMLQVSNKASKLAEFV